MNQTHPNTTPAQATKPGLGPQLAQQWPGLAARIDQERALQDARVEHARQVALIKVTGVLTQDAECRITVGEHHRALLCLRFSQGKGLTYRAVWDRGTTATEVLAARAACSLMRRDTAITVYARGVELLREQGTEYLQLLGTFDAVAHAESILRHLATTPAHLDRPTHPTHPTEGT